MLVIKGDGISYGVAGTLTNMKSINGEPLHTGDVVEILRWNKERQEYVPWSNEIYTDGLTMVCTVDEKWSGDESYWEKKRGLHFIAGLLSACNYDGTIEETWAVKIHKKYYDVNTGEEYSFLHAEEV